MNAISFTLSRKQKQLGPAPFASMEDATAEEKAQIEHQSNHETYHSSNDKYACDFRRTSLTKSLEYPSALAPATPRIDISRASSHSSHHDSRDSSPENVFEQVGTGTLQDSGGLGFREEDTLDLRNSTEELQFMESEEGTSEKEKPNTQFMYCPSAVQRASPIIWKLDDPPTTLLGQLQHQQQLLNRKDSVSSEVVAFLSISGRTSRLSSVGSQGSANSKLSATSALSGISRSPSPHKMLLETSFCGSKPSQNFANGSNANSSLEPGTEKVLEQVILSRKKDPTVAVLAEGVQMQLPTEDCIPPLQPASAIVANVTGFEQHSNGGERHVRRKSDCGTITACLDMMTHFKMGQTSRSVGNKRNIPPRDLKNSIIGVMPSGTEYIRIKLKPDHCYTDNGIADNERVIENAKENGGSEIVIPHHGVSNIIRSPSPANVSVSRKNSFCSLFKFKETTPTDKLHNLQQSQQTRKKRTSSTSNESGAISIDASANLTPSKQKLVLKMFRPKRDSKSKSPSPMGSAPDQLDGEGSVNVGGEYSLSSNKNTTCVPSAAGGYRNWSGKALDGQSIHIPLHTPPEERRPHEALPSSAVNAVATSSVALNGISVSASVTSILKHPKQKQLELKQPRIANMTVTIHDRPRPMPPLKCYRIDNPDGSILIPLKSPVEDKNVDSHHWESVIGELSQRIDKQTSEDQDEAVDMMLSRNKNCKNTDISSTPVLQQECELESLKCNQKRNASSMVASPPTSTPAPLTQPPPPPPLPSSSQLTSALPASLKHQPREVLPKPQKLVSSGMEMLGTLPQQAAAAAKQMQQKQQALFQFRMSSGSHDNIFSTNLNDYSTELEQHSIAGSLHRTDDCLSDISCEQRGKAFAGNCSDMPNEALPAVSVTSSSPQQVLKQERGEKNRMEPHTKLCQGHTHHNTMTNFTDVATTASPKIYKTIAIVANPNIYISPSEGTGNDSTHQNCNQLQQHSQPQINYIQPVEENLQEHDSISTNINPTDRVIGEDAGIVSSESEKDSEMDSVSTADHHILRPNILAIEDHESAGLVFQESFDDELPYIPTTLPEERPVGIKLKPIKERSQIDIRTYHPLERPRSTTPIHLASLEAYCDRTAVVAIMDTAMLAGERSLNSTVNVTEKLHISLPSKKTVDTNGGKKIFEHRSSLGSLTMPLYTPSSAVFFNTTKSVTTGIVGGEQYRSGSTTMKSTVVAEDSQTFTTPPPLPLRKTSASNSMPTGQKWIDVEAIPEMRKAPKRITAIPQKQLLQNISTSLHSRPLETAQDEQFYTYVNPEDCKCECHDHERIMVSNHSPDQQLKMKDEIAESEVPSLQPSSS